MTKDEIINIILNEGEIGAVDDEKYVDISDYIKVENTELAQLVYFKDTKEFYAYCLDDDSNGYWFEYDKLEESVKKQIENLSIWEK